MSVTILAILSLAGGFDDGQKLQRFEFESPHMGTTFRIVVYTHDSGTAQRATKSACQRIAELETIMSNYSQKSELMRLCFANDEKPGMPIPVTEELFDILQKAQAISKLSGGAFDVTVGPVVDLWKDARRTQQFPEADELKEALSLVGTNMLILNPKERTVTLTKPGMRLDLGGIGKGYAADVAIKLLKAEGISSALVAASGDITVSDPPPGAKGWSVDIAPIDKGLPKRTLLLKNASVSTSGDLFQHVVIAGKRYSHVLDPRTGVGLTGYRSVTVIAPTGTLADSLTKVASVLAPVKAIKLLQTKDAETYIVVKENENATPTVTQSKGFNVYLAATQQK